MPVGQYIGWTSPRNVEPIPVKVVSIENQIATLDFNHPLAMGFPGRKCPLSMLRPGCP